MPELEIPPRLRELLAHPQEHLDAELKGWLNLKSDKEHQANLARAIIALANHGGGFVLIGFQNSGVPCPPAEPRPTDFSDYEPDVINRIVAKYAEPGFVCPVMHLALPATGELHPVISVPGVQAVPIEAKRDGPMGSGLIRGKIYIRRSVPESVEPQHWREYWELFARCQRNARGETIPAPAAPEERLQRRLEEWEERARARFDWLAANEPPEELPDRYQHGVWSAAYGIFGEIAEPSDAQFKQMLWTAQAQAPHMRTPLWVIRDGYPEAPYAVEGAWECWLTDDDYLVPYLSEYWLASNEGLMYTLRGYEEDCSIGRQNRGNTSDTPDTPGSVLYLSQPLALVAKVILHAETLSRQFTGEPTTLAFRFRWEGLRGRTLTGRPGQMVISLDLRRHISRQPVVATPTLLIPSSEVRPRLVEWVEKATKPLYRSFNLVDFPSTSIENWLKQTLSRSD